MPISDVYVDWDQKIIHVPKTATQLVQAAPTEIRELDLDLFRLQLKDLEDDVAGMPFDDTHQHNTIVTVGGVTLARVIEIINGYTITFEDDQYAVNLVGANSNVGDVTNVNQVSIRSANSAGLVHIQQLLDQSFAGSIWVDTIAGLPGVQYPRGTPTDPVDNYTDAAAIAVIRKLKSYRLEGSVVLGAGDDLSGTSWLGRSPIASSLTFSGGPTTDAVFKEMLISGTLNGEVALSRCHLSAITNFKGVGHGCVLENGVDIVLDSSPTRATQFLECYSGVPGTGTPSIDLSNMTSSDNIALRSYTGGIRIKNLTVAANVSIDMMAGNVILDSSCTAGTIVVRGLSDFTDNSAGTTIVTDGLIYAKELNDVMLQIRANTSATLGLV